MLRIVRGVMVALGVTLPAPAFAHGLLHPRSAYAVAYYYPAPVVRFYVPAVPPPPLCPPPLVSVPPPVAFAAPVPAPPSASPAAPRAVEPTMPHLPDVVESHSAASPYYDAYPLAARDGKSPGPTAPTVRVWNLSGRDLSVKVDGKPSLIAPGQSVRLTVPRQFVWQVIGREPQSERIPEGDLGLEIVVRR